jgi:hypothetical protein
MREVHALYALGLLLLLNLGIAINFVLLPLLARLDNVRVVFGVDARPRRG